jgi:pimeloyl-ACP methyl ester carboxylesterase
MLTWLLAPALVALSGAGAQRWAEVRDRRRFPAPGRFVRVDGVQLHVVVEGQGPVILIDSGLGGSSIEWGPIARELAQEFTVVRYDRPGFAWSPGADCDRRVVAAAGRIIGLIRALALPAPVLLVGHSLGGLHVRAAASLAPELVRGLVLVDPSDEGMLPVVEASRAAAVTRGVLRSAAWLSPLGIGRLVGRAFGQLALAERRQPLSAEQAEGMRVSGLLTSRTTHGIRALSAEQSALVASLREMAALTARAPAPPIPLALISAAAPSDNPRIVAARAEMDALHTRLVESSPQGRHVLAERSGHLVFLDEPDLIAQTIRETAGLMVVATDPAAPSHE